MIGGDPLGDRLVDLWYWQSVRRVFEPWTRADWLPLHERRFAAATVRHAEQCLRDLSQRGGRS